MAYPVKFEGSNVKLKKPPNMDDLQCTELPIFKNGVNCVSCWEFSEEEIEYILKNKRIYVSIWSGPSQPPLFVGTETDVRMLIADNGVWKK